MRGNCRSTAHLVRSTGSTWRNNLAGTSPALNRRLARNASTLSSTSACSSSYEPYFCLCQVTTGRSLSSREAPKTCSFRSGGLVSREFSSAQSERFVQERDGTQRVSPQLPCFEGLVLGARRRWAAYCLLQPVERGVDVYSPVTNTSAHSEIELWIRASGTTIGVILATSARRSTLLGQV
ncbi:hypothetical protein RRG08_003748 [Elysia crispata]|uniref:Uncharacterized protein n=1 Tax=Elysia crispata TaxID=231223 RepID=A0AAE1AV59_9GAST|nr:hypothetical protein RRG08_003748 [Elysia crispata]